MRRAAGSPVGRLLDGPPTLTIVAIPPPEIAARLIDLVIGQVAGPGDRGS